MELVANSFVAVLLVLLLASKATDAAPRNAATQARKAFAALPVEAEGAQQEEIANALNEEIVEDPRRAPLPWYGVRPDMQQGEQRNWEAVLSAPTLKEKWGALTAQVMNHISSSAGNEQGSKVRAMLDKMSDPEVRKELLRLALGAAGVTASGVLLGDINFLRHVGLVSLYIAALYQILNSGSQLATRLVADAPDPAGLNKKGKARRQKLANLLGVRPEYETASRRMDDQ